MRGDMKAMLIRVITVFKGFLKMGFLLVVAYIFSCIYLAISGEVFSSTRYAFFIWSEEAPFSLNFNVIFAKNLVPFCIIFATSRKCFSAISFWGQNWHILSCFCCQVCLCVLSSLYAPCLLTLSHFVFVSVVDEWFYCVLNCDKKGCIIQNKFFLCLCLLCFRLYYLIFPKPYIKHHRKWLTVHKMGIQVNV